MKTIIKKFISTHWNHQSPLLLALSGGTDSRVLFELLCDLQVEISFPLAIAHVDHRWRASSSAEAKQLQELAEKRNLPFHLKVLDPASLKGNLEAACRAERLVFFKELCQHHGYQAVFLAHHADDQAETVLKKLFEGTSLPYLNALRPATVIDGLNIWRPLLNVRKEQLIEELQRRSILAFEDETNEDPRFLRGRMRTSMLPFLNETFGKSVHASLQMLADEAQELHDYLDSQVSWLLSKVIVGPFGLMLDLKDHLPKSAFEVKHLIRCFCLKAQLPISKQALQEATHFLVEGAANKSLSCSHGMLYIDRYQLFAMPEVHSIENILIELTPGKHLFGPWHVLVETFSSRQKLEPKSNTQTDWKSAWKGTVDVHLESPTIPYALSMAPPACRFQQVTTLRKWWNDAKVPCFMRALFPVVMENDAVKHEFLSGKKQQQALTDKLPIVSITINWQNDKNHKKLEKE